MATDIARFPQDDDELWEFVVTFLGIQIPRIAVCPTHVAPFTAFADAYFARHPITVWKASRGLAGKSYLLATLALMEQITLGAGVSLLGGSGAQSQNVNRYIMRLWNHPHAPRQLLVNGQPGQYITELTNGAFCKALMASQASVRGPHPHRLRLDECLAGDTWVDTPTGTRQMREVRPGDSVYSAVVLPNGQYRGTTANVSAVSQKGVRQTVQLEFSNGNRIVCTPEHKFLTQCGWKEAKDLTCRDAFVSMQKLRNVVEQPFAQQDGAVSTVFNYPTRPEPQSVPWMRKKGLQASNAVHGVSPRVCCGAGAHLQGLRETGIRNVNPLSAMRLSIPSVSQTALRGLRREAEGSWDRPLQTLLAEVPANDERSAPLGCGSGACAEEQNKSDAIRAAMRRLADDDAASVPRASSHRGVYCGLRSCGTQRGRRSVRGVLAQLTQAYQSRQATAPILEAGRVPAYCASTIQNALVDEATTRCVRLVLRKDGPQTDVWDITVDGTHCFFANGVLVHNCDEMDLSIFDAAMGQTLEGQERISPQTVASSTHQYPNGTMTEVLRRAKENSWPVYEWCYRESLQPHGWLAPAEVVRKRSEVTATMWNTEFELQEPSAQGRAITPEAVEQMFDTALGIGDGALGQDLQFEDPEPWGLYSTGADWGRKVHYSAIVTFRLDCTPCRVVAMWRDHRKPYAVMAPVLNRRLQKFPGKGVHDAMGVGDAVREHLTLPVEDYTEWQGKARYALFNEYIAAIEQHKLISPRIAPWYDAHRFLSNDDIFGSGHPPDEIAACALAWHGRPPYLGIHAGDVPILHRERRVLDDALAPTAGSERRAEPTLPGRSNRGGLVI